MKYLELYEAYNKSTIYRILNTVNSDKIDPAHAISVLREFEKLIDVAKKNKYVKKALIDAARYRGVKPSDVYDINAYKDFDSIKFVVYKMRSWAREPKHPAVVKTNELSEAVYKLQEALGLEKTGLLDDITKKAIRDIQKNIAEEWGDEVKDMISYFAKVTEQKKKELELERNQYLKMLEDPSLDNTKRARIRLRIKSIKNKIDDIETKAKQFKITLAHVYNQSGNLDPFTYIKAGRDPRYIKKFGEDIESYHKNDSSFLEASKDDLVIFENEHLKIIRMLSHKVCIDTKLDVIDANKMDDNTDLYNWCILDDPKKYEEYRKKGSTYYAVFQKDRAAREKRYGKPHDGLHFFIALVNSDGTVSIEPAGNPGYSDRVKLSMEDFMVLSFPSENDINGSRYDEVYNRYPLSDEDVPSKNTMMVIMDQVKDMLGQWWSPSKSEMRRIKDGLVHVSYDVKSEIDSDYNPFSGNDIAVYDKYETKERKVSSKIAELNNIENVIKRRHLANKYIFNSSGMLHPKQIIRMLKTTYVGIPESVKSALDDEKDLEKVIRAVEPAFYKFYKGDSVHESYLDSLKKFVFDHYGISFDNAKGHKFHVDKAHENTFAKTALLNDIELSLLSDKNKRDYAKTLKEIIDTLLEKADTRDLRYDSFILRILYEGYRKIADVDKETIDKLASFGIITN